MVVSKQEIFGTIGGGHLEYQIILEGRRRIDLMQHGNVLLNFQLGAKLGQCCGGTVEVFLESFFTTSAPVVIFGAGHIGRALVRILEPLEIAVDWIDQRSSEFPEAVSPWVRVLVSEDPVGEGAYVSQGAAVMIMTHSHAMDFDLCEYFLKREDLSFLGLIGSDTKRKTFETRLKSRGVAEDAIARLSCPAGRKLGSKHPAAIAVSLASEILAAVFMNQDSTNMVSCDMVVE
jgi:xanthine dehydrogenase accessory factor